jgi:hypothetical protein
MAVQYGVGADGTNKEFTASDTVKSLYGTGVPNGGQTGIWTPASGKKFRINSFTIAASVAGLYALLDGAVPFAYVYMPVGVVTVNLGNPGYTSTTANNILYVQNQSGVAANQSLIASGTEVL